MSPLGWLEGHDCSQATCDVFEAVDPATMRFTT